MGFGLAPADSTPAIGYDGADLVFNIRIGHESIGQGRIGLERMRLAGRHNLANAMAAAAAALVVGIGPRAIETALADFAGLPHRMEFVAERGGVTYIDDSKGTNVASVVEALAAVRAPVILIAGGMDKGGDYAPLREPLGEKVKLLILIGAARDRMRAALQGATEIELAQTLAEAVRRAAVAARRGATVLLSPACSSFDQFRDYAERGRHISGAGSGALKRLSRPQPDPWLYLPAAALAGIGLPDGAQHHLFPGPGKNRRRVPFLQAAALPYRGRAGGARALSQFSLRGLRRLVVPLMVLALVMLVAAVDSRARRDARRGAAMAQARAAARGAVGAGEIRDGLFPRRLFQPAPGADEHVSTRVRCPRLSSSGRSR